MKRRLILRNFQSPGDVLMLTAAVRDLHQCHPGQFETDVRTSCPALWENNSHLRALNEQGRGVEVLDCHYPLIHESNQASFHFIWGFMAYLNEKLGTRVKPTRFHGDVHLSAREKEDGGPVRRLLGKGVPYWLIVAGGKYDFTIKWWHFRRFQQVVDHFRSRIQFVQVGETGHYHPGLAGVIDLRGQTSLRELIQLVYHADGVVCPVTLLMHLAAAVEMPPGSAPNRACVVVAGGREPPQWEAYPHHQFIHTVGALPCCATGGCWRSRTVPLGDGDDKDDPKRLCLDVVQGLPRCMAMITPELVIQRIEWHFARGMARYLSKTEARRASSQATRSCREQYLSAVPRA